MDSRSPSEASFKILLADWSLSEFLSFCIAKKQTIAKLKNNYYFKMCTKFLANENQIKQFHQLPFKNKISFSLKTNDVLKEVSHFKVLERD